MSPSVALLRAGAPWGGWAALLLGSRLASSFNKPCRNPPRRASRPPPKARSLTHSSSLAHAHLPCFPAPPACSHQQQKEGEGGETVDDDARRKGRQAKDRAGRAAEDAAEGAKRGWFGLKVGDALG